VATLCRWSALLLMVLLPSMVVACGPGYSNPPLNLLDSELAGTWEGCYGEWGIDKLFIQTNGTFKQVYQDYSVDGYVYETPWKEWWAERFPDGRMRVHLLGARYYSAGITIAELDGLAYPYAEYADAFYDPIADESVEMVGEVVLNVQIDAGGDLVLLHMLGSRDDGFVSLFTGKARGFQRVEDG
jgi:hypothetical protein